MRNAELALADLVTRTTDPSSAALAGFNTRDHIHLSTDSFFAFLYSALDVMAQVINQARGLGLREDQVSFARVRQHIAAGTPLREAWDGAESTHWFKNLDRYRNCSTHRRQIYIEQRISQIHGTPGYSATGRVDRTRWIICDNPLSLRPTTKQDRELVAQCRKELEGVRTFLRHVIPLV